MHAVNWKSAAAVLLLRIAPAIVGLAAMGLLVAWLVGMFEAKTPPGQLEAQVRRVGNRPTSAVHEVTKDYIDEAIGTLRAASRTAISAKVLATIDEIRVRAGDRVAQGDVLIRLDEQELAARAEQAQRTLASAQATYTQADADYKRYADVRRNDPRAISDERFDEISAARLRAEAEQARAEHAVREAEILRSYATITAPKSGTIVDRLAEPGDVARPGEPLLVLYDATSLRLEAPVSEELAVLLRPGDALRVHIDSLNRELGATIDEIVPQSQTPSRSLLVKASLPPTEGLYEGLVGRLRIPAGERRHVCLDTAAIQRIGQLEFVDVVRNDGTLERRLIKTGRLGMPGRIEVLSGLRPGEIVALHDVQDSSARDDRPDAG